MSIIDSMKEKAESKGKVKGYSQIYPTYELGLQYKGYIRVFPVEGVQGYIWLDDGEGGTTHYVKETPKDVQDAAKADSKDGSWWGQVDSGAVTGIGTALEDVKTPFEIPFMYNPTNYQESKGITWKEWDVLGKTTLRKFVGKEAKTIKMELFADSTLGGVAGGVEGRAVNVIPPKGQHFTNEAGMLTKLFPLKRPTVAHYVNMWKALVLDKEALQDTIVQEQFKNNILTRPPFCVLTIGAHYEYQVVLSKVDVDYDMFDNALNPIRARIKLTFHEVYEGYYGELDEIGKRYSEGEGTIGKIKRSLRQQKRASLGYTTKSGSGGKLPPQISFT